jgi:hypothetical protein
MSLDALKQEIAALDGTARRELMSYLMALRQEKLAAFVNEAAKRLDDPNTEWLTLEEMKARLDQIPEPVE